MFKKHFFLNNIFIFSLIAVILSLWFAIVIVSSEAWVGAMFFIVAAAAAVCIVLYPHYHVIDDKGIRIYYIFLLKEDYKWKGIEEVYITYDSGHRPIPFILDTFCIIGYSESKDYFFMRSEITRSRKARKLIEHYTGKRIQGFMIDDFKEDIRNLKVRYRKHFPDKSTIKALEKTAEGQLKEILPDARIEYFYQTKAAEQLTRPKGNSTYCARVEDRIIPLVEIRLKKNIYHARLRKDIFKILKEEQICTE